VGTVVSESVGSATVTETLMEEILVAQRGPAGGDRIGDADTVIRISEGAAGALQVKVRRDGDDLSLRVRAEDLAMRHVMAESLPELKHELQKANLVEGDIEVREDGIEDQMQSDFEWDDNQSARRDPQRESGHEVETAYDAPIVGNQQSNTTTARRHDGELYVVA
jgi:flagellar hook-length control protein FliK